MDDRAILLNEGVPWSLDASLSDPIKQRGAVITWCGLFVILYNTAEDLAWSLYETQIDDEASPNKGQELRIIATKMYITL